MNEQVSFTLRGRNPDVLTCIANLSNDEVFTPPELAGRMLDMLAQAWSQDHGGANLWADKTVRFLDPFTKSGVFLREITSRLTEGLAQQMSDLQERVNHILTQQVFGIGITKLTSLLARRSVYCSKYANGAHSIAKGFDSDAGNIWFERTEHTWADGKCTFCGASQAAMDRGADLETHAYAFIHTDNIKTLIPELFGEAMQFDVIVGNPPYQLTDGGFGTSAAPIYQKFVEQAKALEPRYLSMVIPARWYAGGKGLDEFRESMLGDNKLRAIHDYWLVGDVFPGVAIQGGILYFLWGRDHPGNCEVVTHYGGADLSRANRPLLEQGADVFIRYNEAVPILKKIVEAEGGKAGSVLLPVAKRFANLVSSRKPFGLDTKFKARSDKRQGDVIAYWNGGPGFKQGGKGWVSLSDVRAGHDLIEKWKVFIGGAYGDRGGGGASRDAPPKAVLGRPFVGEPGSISTETYICLGPFSSQSESNNAISYISCKLTRFLVMLHKPSQDATKKVYTFVPTQDFSETWTDQRLYAKYGLTDKEIEFVEWMIRPMDLNSATSEDAAEIDADE